MLFLGVDGGGTKTKAVLLDETGKLLGMGISGPTNLLENGKDHFLKNLKECLDEFSELMYKEKNIYSCFGLPAIGEFRNSEEIVSNLIERNLGIKPNLVVNDVVVGWAAGTLGKDGVHIVAGTGAIVYGKKSNRTIRVTGWGSLIGDEGSAYHIGLETLREVSKQLDGRRRNTILKEIIFKGLKLKDNYDFLEFIYSSGDRRKKIASIAPLTYNAALQGDPISLKILKKAGFELGLAVYTAVKQLELVNPLITFNGGVLEKNKFVKETFENYLKKKIKNPTIKAVELDPSLGAVILAYLLVNKKLPEDFILKLKEINSKFIN